MQVVFLHLVEVGDAEGADAGGGEVERGRTAESAGADHQDPGGREFLLSRHAESLEQNLAAVARELGGRKVGRRGGHRGEREPEVRRSQLKLRRARGRGGMGRCVVWESTTAPAGSG